MYGMKGVVIHEIQLSKFTAGIGFICPKLIGEADDNRPMQILSFQSKRKGERTNNYNSLLNRPILLNSSLFSKITYNEQAIGGGDLRVQNFKTYTKCRTRNKNLETGQSKPLNMGGVSGSSRFLTLRIFLKKGPYFSIKISA